MATKTTPSVQDALDEEWETITTGIGEKWPIEQEPLIGNFLGTVIRPMKDPDSESGERDQPVHQFSPRGAGPDEIAFVWGSYELDEALSKATQGQLCKITFTGESSFRSDAGPRRIKHYKVQISKR